MPNNLLKWPLWVSLAIREISASRLFSLFFIMNLAIGMAGFLTVNSFKQAIETYLSTQSKQMAGADLIINSRHPLSAQELKQINQALPPNTQVRQEASLFTMVSSHNSSRLVQVQAVDHQYPFYGTLELSESIVINQRTPKAINTKMVAWISPELLIQLNIQLGDSIKLGAQSYRVTNLIQKDPSVSTVGFAVLPKVMIGLHSLEKTGLVVLGSRIFYKQAFKTTLGLNDLKTLKQKLSNTLQTADDIKIKTHRQSSRELSRLLTYLNDYLGLVSLIALFLSGVGATYLFRSLLNKRLKDMAIFLSLGLPHHQLFKLYVFKFFILGLIAALLSTILATWLLPLLPAVSGDLISDKLPLTLSVETSVMSTLVVIMGGLLFCLPPLLKIRSVQPALLFNEQAPLPSRKKGWLAYLPALIFYWALSCWQAQSFLIGNLFVVSLLITILLLAILLVLILLFLKISFRKPHFVRDMAILNLTRHKASTLTCFLALGMGAVLVNIVPQLYKVMENQLINPQQSQLPGLFLFDIQEEQIEPLTRFITNQSASLNYVSPMIQARLIAHNDTPIQSDQTAAQHTREQQWEERLKRRTYNLTIREQLGASEKRISGRPFSGVYDWDADQLPEISVEKNFAKRLGLKLEDRLTFDIQEVIIEAKVVSIRNVRWTSFHPNFYIQFQRGVLEDSPKTYIAAIPPLPLTQKVQLQNAIVKEFSNVSIIDVDKSVQKILSISAQAKNAISLMTWITLTAGLAVLFFIARFQAQERQFSFTLLKVLGCQFSQIRQISLYEFAILGFITALSGTLLSLITTGLLS